MKNLAVLITALGTACTAVAAGAQTPNRLDGEYGLMVQERGDSVFVHWITRGAGAGTLRVSSGREEVANLTTNGPFAHRAAFARPRADSLRLEYGSAADPADRHATTLYFNALPRTIAVPRADSIFVFGDTHGEFDRVTRLLRASGLIDDRLRWAGSRAHLVFSGDLMDRGADVTRLLWFVYGLERQVRAAGGQLHLLLGNHETMVMLNDLRYTSAKEMYIAQMHEVGYSRMYDARESTLGKWLVRKPAVLRIDDVLFAHGGVSSDFISYTLQSFDDSLRTFITEDLFYRWSDSTAVIPVERSALERREHFFLDPNSVFWFRGYARSDTLGNTLSRVLRRFDSRLHVIGHTPTPSIEQRYDARLINAHGPEFASEMLLLVREGAGWKRFSIDAAGKRAELPIRSD